MGMKEIKLIGVLMFLFCGAIGAQTTEEIDPMKEGTIKEQFDYVIKKSSTYEEFKVVRLRFLNQLKTNADDSIRHLNSELSGAHLEIRNGEAVQDSLRNVIADLKVQYENAVKSKNSFSFLGMELGKALYNSIMWGLVLGMVAFVIVTFLAFKRSHHVTKETKVRLAEVEEEFETHRKTALRREQKLARELMDERMKGKI